MAALLWLCGIEHDAACGMFFVLYKATDIFVKSTATQLLATISATFEHSLTCEQASLEVISTTVQHLVDKPLLYQS